MAKNKRNPSSTILVKYGGNAMVNADVQKAVVENISKLAQQGIRIVIVHGGGPFIQQALDEKGIKSEFVDGQRVTSKEALVEVERALKGYVNARLVGLLNQSGLRAIGLSGKDGRLVTAKKRYHTSWVDGEEKVVDIGRVGDVAAVDTDLLEALLDRGLTPVLTCIASDGDGNDYNVNADMFAGHVAGALNVDLYLVLTDIDGLLETLDDPNSIIHSASLSSIRTLMENGIIKGGMIPKMDSCAIALNQGAKAARILNGTKPETISRALEDENIGTQITAT